MSPFETVQSFILTNQQEELITFLQATPNSTHKEIKTGVRLLSQQLQETHIPRDDIRQEQCLLCYLAAIILFTKTELMSLPPYLGRRTDVESDVLIRLFQYRDFGPWLQSWIMNMISKRYWFPTYRMLLQLESQQLISYDPVLFGNAITPTNVDLTFEEMEQIVGTSTLHQDVLTFFTRVDTNWSNYFNHECTPFILGLIAKNIITRKEALWEILQNLIRDDSRREKLQWLKNIGEKISPSSEEKLEFQAEFFAVLTNQHGIGINWVLDELKPIARHPAFLWAQFLQALELLLSGKHHKLGASRALSLLAELPLHHPSSRVEMIRVALPVFLTKDAALQEKTVQLVARWSIPEDEWLREELMLYADVLPANAQEFLGQFVSSTPPEPAERYVRQPEAVLPLTDEQRIVPITHWDDVLFLIGKCSEHYEIEMVEQLLVSLLLIGTDLPEDYQEQVSVYNFNQFIKSPEWFIHGFLWDWTRKFQTSGLQSLLDRNRNDDFVTVFWVRLMYAQELAKANVRLPLLSTPTHQSCWIDAEELVERVLAYEKRQVRINEIDLAVALTRVHVGYTQAALAKAQHIQTPNLRRLMVYLFDEVSNLQQSLEELQPYSFHQILHEELESFTSEEIWPMLFAVAARTKNYLGTYPEFEAYPFGLLPNVSKPYLTSWGTGYVYYKEQPYSENCKETVLPILTTEVFPYLFKPLVLLYSQHYFGEYALTHSDWYDGKRFVSIHGISYVFSILPNYTDPLCFRALKASGQSAESGPNESKSILRDSMALLPSIQTPLGDNAHLLLVAGFLNDAEYNRRMAVDVFAELIFKRRINQALVAQVVGVLLVHEYSSIQRFLNALSSIINLSALHNDVACTMLEEILVRINVEKPLKNTKKIILQYADLQQKTKREIPLALEERLQTWATNSALKKEIATVKRA